MAEETQLTVAELLARSGKNSSAGKQSRPRRRRSLEDGGVSVAELTGSIPKVNAKPVEARHSNVPLDDSTAVPGDTEVKDETPAPQVAAPATVTEKTEKPKTEKPPVEKASAEKPKTEKSKTEKSKTGQRPADGAATPKPGDPEAEGQQNGNERSGSQPAGEGKPAAETPKQSPADKFAAAKAAATATAATETPAATPETAAGSTGVSLSHDDTQVISAVAGAAPNRTGVAAVPGPVKTGVTTAAQSAAAAVPAGLATGFAQTSEATGEIPMVGEPAESDAYEQDADEDESAVSVGTVIGLAVVGIILGVLVFLGFDYLWGNFNRLFVGIAALVVTGVMVLGTRMLRTSNDAFSMVLAGAVGLLMTFGPALIMYLT